MAHAVEPCRSRVHARLYRANGSGAVETDEIRMRTVLALRFGHQRSDGTLREWAVDLSPQASSGV
jgi:hypothetical protein